jgi:hypothetical protein
MLSSENLGLNGFIVEKRNDKQKAMDFITIGRFGCQPSQSYHIQWNQEPRYTPNYKGNNRASYIPRLV